MPMCTMDTLYKLKICFIIFNLLADIASGSSDLHTFAEALRRGADIVPNQSFHMTILDDMIADYNDEMENLMRMTNQDLSDENLYGNNSIIESQALAMLRSGAVPIFGPNKRHRQRGITKAPKTTAKRAWSSKQLSDHNRRVDEISAHMSTHFMSTLYLYNEVERIKKQGVVMDDIRIMAADLEHPNNKRAKNYVAYCYKKYKPLPLLTSWIHKPNNAVINVVKDPINDGVI